MDTDSDLPDLVRTRVGDAVASCPAAMALLKEGLLQAAGPGGTGVEAPALQVGRKGGPYSVLLPNCCRQTSWIAGPLPLSTSHLLQGIH
jgi:hypothetical protein